MPTALKAMSEPEELTILLVEDVAGDAAAITKALVFGETLYSFHVHRKASLAEGLEFLRTHTVDAVLLDLGLPDAVALTALNKVHNLFPDLPIVIISGYVTIDRVHDALRGGAQEFLIKGECSGATIRQSIYQAIARKKIALSYQRGERL